MFHLSKDGYSYLNSSCKGRAGLKGESFYTASWACDVERNPFVVAGGLNGIIRVINVNDKMVYKTLVGHEDSVSEIKTHPMIPQLVLSASKDGSVRLWNVETVICILIFSGTGGHDLQF
ncbi:hypothetical protein Bca4012_073439 [Brassica carinata]